MGLLIEKGLMFGGLVHVNSAALADRYNRALEHLTGHRTELSDFHIDLAGFSPEIGDELGDMSYLNQGGVNRQFILLTLDQRRSPLLNMQFSTSRRILTDWVAENESALFALTARDAVAGELLNTVYRADRPSQLLAIRRITVEADTTQAHLADARTLADKIEEFRTREDAWWDDVLIAEMIGLAKRTGDVTRNPVMLSRTAAEQGNFWTAHFGGSYVFRDAARPFAVTGQKPAWTIDADVPMPAHGLDDRNAIAQALVDNALVEPIVKARGVDGSGIIRQKMDFILIDAAAEQGIDLTGVTRRDLRMLARRMGPRLPEAFLGLAELLRWAEAGGAWPRIASDHPAYFYTLRSAAHGDADLVNRLLAELAPLDFRQLFICHKELFYRLYADWTPSRQAYVAEFLEREYQVDKAGMRQALFGHEPGMEPPPPPPAVAPSKAPATAARRARKNDLVTRVGPWGAVRR
ncbi:hypothetical protein DXV76_08770 [Rhodobacteraceae bacterium CCMM004]|nr:hypothetical protein DXV76_08770 [Rhodobacteraceae bacterium CCMM004]